MTSYDATFEFCELRYFVIIKNMIFLLFLLMQPVPYSTYLNCAITGSRGHPTQVLSVTSRTVFWDASTRGLVSTRCSVYWATSLYCPGIQTLQFHAKKTQAFRLRSHMTTTMWFFLSSCANSYIGDNATHLWRHGLNIKNLCRCHYVWTTLRSDFRPCTVMSNAPWVIVTRISLWIDRQT